MLLSKMNQSNNMKLFLKVYTVITVGGAAVLVVAKLAGLLVGLSWWIVTAPIWGSVVLACIVVWVALWVLSKYNFPEDDNK